MSPMGGEAVKKLAVAMAAAVAAADEANARSVVDALTGLSGRDWLRLDEVSRQSWTWAEAGPDVVPVAAPGVELVRLVLTSMDRNGWKRQAAVEALATVGGTVAAAAIAVRVSDWVDQVADEAARSLGRLDDDQVAGCVAVLLAGADRSRGHDVATAHLQACADGSLDRLRRLAGAGERSVRVWALDNLVGRQAVDAPALVGLASADADPQVALWAARRLLGDGGQFTPEVVGELVSSRRAVVRAFVTRHGDGAALTQPVLVALLLDRSGAVRAMARWRWGQRWGSPASTYLSVLAAGGGPAMTAAALQGLDDCAHPEAVQVAATYLDHPSPAVRRAAVQTVGRRGRTDQVVALLPRMLVDPAARVSATATRYLARADAGLPEQVWAILSGAATPAAARTTLRLRQKQGTWERVIADLDAMSARGDLEDLGRRDLLAWLQHGAASTYSRPTPTQAAHLADLLKDVDLAHGAKREVAFTAGLPAPIPPTTQGPPRPSGLGKLLTWRNRPTQGNL